MAGDESVLSDVWVIGDVALSVKMGQMLVCKGGEVIAGAVKGRRWSFISRVAGDSN